MVGITRYYTRLARYTVPRCWVPHNLSNYPSLRRAVAAGLLHEPRADRCAVDVQLPARLGQRHGMAALRRALGRLWCATRYAVRAVGPRLARVRRTRSVPTPQAAPQAHTVRRRPVRVPRTYGTAAALYGHMSIHACHRPEVAAVDHDQGTLLEGLASIQPETVAAARAADAHAPVGEAGEGVAAAAEELGAVERPG